MTSTLQNASQMKNNSLVEEWPGTKVLPLAEIVRMAKSVAPSASIAYIKRQVAVAV